LPFSPGVATQDGLRQQALVVPDKAERVYHFHQQTLHALQELVQAAGVQHPNQITAHHMMRRTGDHTVTSLAQALLHEVPVGSLLSDQLEGLPQLYRRHWAHARAESFALA
jgi:hypothetical protein